MSGLVLLAVVSAILWIGIFAMIFGMVKRQPDLQRDISGLEKSVQPDHKP